MSTSADPRRERLRSRYFGRSEWPRELDPLLDAAPAVLEAYLRLSAVPWRTDVLGSRLKHLVYVAVDAVPLQFYPPGLRMHASAALESGARPQDIDAVVAIAGLTSFEAVVEGMCALEGASVVAGRPDDPDSATLRTRFAAVRGAWDPRLEPVLRHAELARAWIEVVEATWAMPTELSYAEREVVLACALAAGGHPASTLEFPVSRAVAGGMGVAAVLDAVALVAPLGMHALADALACIRES